MLNKVKILVLYSKTFFEKLMHYNLKSIDKIRKAKGYICSERRKKKSFKNCLIYITGFCLILLENKKIHYNKFMHRH